jgi:serine/threonine protein phosphatase 1
VPLRGNHEIMMLAARGGGRALADWLAVGGDATPASYAPLDGPGRLADVPDEHWAFLENDLLPYHETDTHLFVHAGAYPDLPLAEQPDFMLYWEQFDDPPPHGSGKVVCGHTSQKTGDPRTVGHAVCIDTWAHGRGWLTCFDAISGQYWQADQAGRARGGWMSDHE